MITIDRMSYGYPQKDLFDTISFTIESGDHCGFIGASGSGKSTLVQLLLHSDDYIHSGKITIDEGWRIGYVRQFSELAKDETRSVYDYLAEPFLRIEQKIAKICTAMETATELDELLIQYQDALDAFDAIGGDQYDSMIKNQLGLANLAHLMDKPLTTLSGGEFKLIQVIGEMSFSPDLMIMDEPDVFLDFDHLNGLRQLINRYKGSMLVITHNRFLLDHCFNKILHLENQQLMVFEGSFIEYNFALLLEKIDTMEQAIKDEDELARNEALIERLRDVSTVNADPARGRSLKARVKIHERLLKSRTHAPFVDIKQPDLRFMETPVPSHATADTIAEVDATQEATPLLQLDDYHLAFDKPLLDHVNLSLMYGEKAAIIGANGTGKTSLFKDIVKGEKDTIVYHDSTVLGYLSQEQRETLDDNARVEDAFWDLGFERRQDIIDYLADFHMEEERLTHPIRDLSGGEKNLLQLALLAYQPTNLLLLDEPTSHLDTYTQLALEKALNAYKGSVLMISHDYYSIVGSMDYVYLIEDGTLRKSTMKKFKRRIYGKYFDKEYLLLEEKKKELETTIALALKERLIDKARTASDELALLIESMGIKH